MADILFELYRRKDLTREELLNVVKNSHKSKDPQLGVVVASVPISRNDYTFIAQNQCLSCKSDLCEASLLYFKPGNNKDKFCQDCIISSTSFDKWKIGKYKEFDPMCDNYNNWSYVEDFWFKTFIKEQGIKNFQFQEYKCGLCDDYADDNDDFLIDCGNDCRYCQQCAIAFETRNALILSNIIPVDICNIIYGYLAKSFDRGNDATIFEQSREKTLVGKLLPIPDLKKFVQSFFPSKKVFQIFKGCSLSVAFGISESAKKWINSNEYEATFEYGHSWGEENFIDILIYYKHPLLLPTDTLCRMFSNHILKYSASFIKEYVEFAEIHADDIKEEEDDYGICENFILMSIPYSDICDKKKVSKKEFKQLCKDAFHTIKLDYQYWLPGLTKTEVDYIILKEEHKKSFCFCLLEKNRKQVNK
jgi:hypothetical protein